ncbi:hypothetical protein D3C85_1023480 [compost metagenome]
MAHLDTTDERAEHLLAVALARGETAAIAQVARRIVLQGAVAEHAIEEDAFARAQAAIHGRHGAVGRAAAAVLAHVAAVMAETGTDAHGCQVAEAVVAAHAHAVGAEAEARLAAVHIVLAEVDRATEPQS